MMRTTLDLPDDVHQSVRELAHQQGKSMGTVVAELIMAARAPTRPVVEETGLLSSALDDASTAVTEIKNAMTQYRDATAPKVTASAGGS